MLSVGTATSRSPAAAFGATPEAPFVFFYTRVTHWRTSLSGKTIYEREHDHLKAQTLEEAKQQALAEWERMNEPGKRDKDLYYIKPTLLQVARIDCDFPDGLSPFKP